MNYRAVLFDLDDTLYDYRAYWHEKLRHALHEVVAAHPRLELNRLIAEAVGQNIYSEGLPAWLAGYGVEDAALIAAAQARYRENWWERLSLFDDAPELLALLRPRYKLGLITNGPTRTQRPKIARFALEGLLDTIVVSEEVGVAKPDPAIFMLALDSLGVAPHEALYVGDSPIYDLAGAQAAGIACVWLNRRGEALPAGLAPPLATITRLGEVAGLCE